VFLDSSGFLALVSQTDAYHPAASRAWTTLIIREGWRAYTSNFVLAETHALFLTRLGQGPATAFLRQMERSATTVLPVSPTDETAARQIIYRYTDKRFSFTDATSFVLMETHDITVALTSDRNFAQYGFQMLGAERR
jgi:predicted nucleic acid-binding protein